jgi:hypothetical protein
MINVQNIEMLTHRQLVDMNDDKSFEEVIEVEDYSDFFAPSTCCAGTFPEHAQQNF